MQPVFLAGYAEYILVIMLPGLGFGELLGVWKENDSLAERAGYVVGLGLAVDTIVLLVRTSGFSIGGFSLSRMDTGTLYALIIAGLLALFASVGLRRRFVFPRKPSATDLVLLSVILVQGIIILLYFQKYPIFPEYQSEDYAAHVTLAQGLIGGSVVSIPSGVLYYGVHFQLASGILLVGGEALATAQRVMAILVLLSPAVVLLASSRVFASRGAGLVTTIVYTLSGTLWYVSVFNAGLYANFFGLVTGLVLIAGFVDLGAKIRSVSSWIVFLLVLIMSYFSHYTVLTVFPALFAVPVLQYARTRSNVLGHALPSLAAVVPGVAAFLLAPGEVSKALYYAELGAGAISGSTYLSNALTAWPVAQYMSLEVTSDVGFVFLVGFAAVFVWKWKRFKGAVFALPLVWFVVLVIAAPLNVQAWRFSLEALLPLTLMAGSGAFLLLPKVGNERKRRRETGHGRYLKVAVVLAVLLTPLLVTSWGEQSLSDSVADTGISASAQQGVYTALYWIRNNTPANSSYLSVSDWRFAYTELFFGRTTAYAFASQPGPALALAKEYGYAYIIVTNLATASLPPVPSLFPWNNFHPSSNLTLVYSNDDVEVFKVV